MTDLSLIKDKILKLDSVFAIIGEKNANLKVAENQSKSLLITCKELQAKNEELEKSLSTHKDLYLGITTKYNEEIRKIDSEKNKYEKLNSEYNEAHQSFIKFINHFKKLYLNFDVESKGGASLSRIISKTLCLFKKVHSRELDQSNELTTQLDAKKQIEDHLTAENLNLLNTVEKLQHRIKELEKQVKEVLSKEDVKENYAIYNQNSLNNDSISDMAVKNILNREKEYPEMLKPISSYNSSPNYSKLSVVASPINSESSEIPSFLTLNDLSTNELLENLNRSETSLIEKEIVQSFEIPEDINKLLKDSFTQTEIFDAKPHIKQTPDLSRKKSKIKDDPDTKHSKKIKQKTTCTNTEILQQNSIAIQTDAPKNEIYVNRQSQTDLIYPGNKQLKNNKAIKSRLTIRNALKFLKRANVDITLSNGRLVSYNKRSGSSNKLTGRKLEDRIFARLLDHFDSNGSLGSIKNCRLKRLQEKINLLERDVSTSDTDSSGYRIKKRFHGFDSGYTSGSSPNISNNTITENNYTSVLPTSLPEHASLEIIKKDSEESATEHVKLLEENNKDNHLPSQVDIRNEVTKPPSKLSIGQTFQIEENNSKTIKDNITTLVKTVNQQQRILKNFNRMRVGSKTHSSKLKPKVDPSNVTKTTTMAKLIKSIAAPLKVSTPIETKTIKSMEASNISIKDDQSFAGFSQSDIKAEDNYHNYWLESCYLTKTSYIDIMLKEMIMLPPLLDKISGDEGEVHVREDCTEIECVKDKPKSAILTMGNKTEETYCKRLYKKRALKTETGSKRKSEEETILAEGKKVLLTEKNLTKDIEVVSNDLYLSDSSVDEAPVEINTVVERCKDMKSNKGSPQKATKRKLIELECTKEELHQTSNSYACELKLVQEKLKKIQNGNLNCISINNDINIGAENGKGMVSNDVRSLEATKNEVMELPQTSNYNGEEWTLALEQLMKLQNENSSVKDNESEMIAENYKYPKIEDINELPQTSERYALEFKLSQDKFKKIHTRNTVTSEHRVNEDNFINNESKMVANNYTLTKIEDINELPQTSERYALEWKLSQDKFKKIHTRNTVASEHRVNEDNFINNESKVVANNYTVTKSNASSTLQDTNTEKIIKLERKDDVSQTSKTFALEWKLAQERLKKIENSSNSISVEHQDEEIKLKNDNVQATKRKKIMELKSIQNELPQTSGSFTHEWKLAQEQLKKIRNSNNTSFEHQGEDNILINHNDNTKAADNHCDNTLEPITVNVQTSVMQESSASGEKPVKPNQNNVWVVQKERSHEKQFVPKSKIETKEWITFYLFKRLFRRVVQYKGEEIYFNTLVEHLSTTDTQTLTSHILREIISDKSQREKGTTPFEPYLSCLQKVAIALILRVETSRQISYVDEFLDACERQLLFHEKNVNALENVTRVYAALCKMRKMKYRLRRIIVDGLYFMDDLVIPMVFFIVSTWVQVLWKHTEDDKDEPLIKLLVQFLHIKQNKHPEYNFCVLKNMLEVYYRYPRERYNENNLIKEFLEKYMCTLSTNFEIAILILCKLYPDTWALKQLQLIQELTCILKNKDVKKGVGGLMQKILLQIKDQTVKKKAKELITHLDATQPATSVIANL